MSCVSHPIVPKTVRVSETKLLPDGQLVANHDRMSIHSLSDGGISACGTWKCGAPGNAAPEAVFFSGDVSSVPTMQWLKDLGLNELQVAMS